MASSDLKFVWCSPAWTDNVEIDGCSGALALLVGPFPLREAFEGEAVGKMRPSDCFVTVVLVKVRRLVLGQPGARLCSARRAKVAFVLAKDVSDPWVLTPKLRTTSGPQKLPESLDEADAKVLLVKPARLGKTPWRRFPLKQ